MKKNKISKIEYSYEKLSKVFPNLFKKKYKKIYFQIFKFIVVGGIATIIDFILLILLKELLSLNTIIANTISFSVSTIYNYIASVKWVFDVNKKKNSSVNFILFIIFSILGLIINNIILSICIEMLNAHYIVSKILATMFVMIFNFVTRKKFLE